MLLSITFELQSTRLYKFFRMKSISLLNSAPLNLRLTNNTKLREGRSSCLRISLLVLIVVLASCNTKEEQEKTKIWAATAPAGSQYTHIDRQGTTVIPNGRLITPFGKQIT